MTVSINKPRRGRPPKSHSNEHDTRTALIRSGLEQLTESGFAASGIDGILKKVGVPKGSFYHYFASKEAFGMAVLDSYATYFAKKLDLFLLDESHSPLERVRNFVIDAQQGMAKHEFKRGCLVGNLGQEVDLLPESFRQPLIQVFSNWQQKLAQCFYAAQHNGELAASAQCDALAEYFWIGWEGAVSRAKLVKSSAPLESFYSQFMMSLPK
ncbi:TetR/AcrR family transcriptional regulator [Pseudoalteromonas sp. YIC-656]|uniref:acrylate utilization transcriptional regulator AcuR n=1 Tax=Pseudoalteromonas pernae TaxID=3118054 RepID=UPI003242C28C